MVVECVGAVEGPLAKRQEKGSVGCQIAAIAAEGVGDNVAAVAVAVEEDSVVAGLEDSMVVEDMCLRLRLEEAHSIAVVVDEEPLGRPLEEVGMSILT